MLKFIACAILSALILVELILLLIYYVYIIKTNRTLDINDFAIIDFVALQKENDAKIELLNKNNKKWDALKNSKKYNILFNQYEKLDNEINSVNKKNYFITIEKVIEFNETYVSYFNIKLNYSLKKLSLILLIKLQKSDILSS
ncbi:MAG: hypothetical protein LBB39_03905 [Mycoplasmataceae bacterium]|nr:hypothetical protein [Mycoplasmataceae bacterium]